MPTRERTRRSYPPGWDRLSSALYENDPRLTKTQDVIRLLLARLPGEYNRVPIPTCMRATGVSASHCYRALKGLVKLGYAQRNQHGEYKFLGKPAGKNDTDRAIHGLCGNCGEITTGTIPGYMPTLPELTTQFACCVTGDGWRLTKLIYRKCVWHEGGNLIVKRPLAWTISDFGQQLGWSESRAQAALKELREVGAIEREPDPDHPKRYRWWPNFEGIKRAKPRARRKVVQPLRKQRMRNAERPQITEGESQLRSPAPIAAKRQNPTIQGESAEMSPAHSGRQDES